MQFSSFLFRVCLLFAFWSALGIAETQNVSAQGANLQGVNAQRRGDKGNAQISMSLSPLTLPTQYLYDSWTSESGSPPLPQDIAPVSIAQTADGYIWIATSTGLFRFDGARFVTIDTLSAAALHGNDIKTLYAPPGSSRLWIGTGGEGLFCRRNGKFVRRAGDANSEYAFIRALYRDSRGMLWIGSQSGAFVLREDTETSDAAQPAKNVPEGEITAIVEDAAHRIWLGTQQNGVYIVEGGKTRHLTMAEGLADDVVTALVADSAGGVWVGTASQGAQRWENNVVTDHLTAARGLSGNAVASMLVARNGTLWIGASNGLNRVYDGDVTIFTPTSAGLSSATILSLCEDREGSLWIAAGGSGIDRIKEPKFAVFGKKEGLPYDVFSTALYDHPGKLWLGSFYNTGITLMENGATRLFDYPRTRGIPPGAFVRALCRDNEGRMWFGTAGAGLIRYENGVFTSWKAAEQSIAHNTIRALFTDSRGRLWIGSFGGGILRFDPNANGGKGAIIPTYSTANGLASDYIFALTEDKRGRIWAATRDGGVNIIDESGGVSVLDANNGLPANTALYVAADAKGNIWIGTQFGVAVWRAKENGATAGGELRFIRASDGLLEEATRWMIQDAAGNYWFSGLSGIYSLAADVCADFLSGARSRLEMEAFGKSDGMRSVECNGNNQPAAALDAEGRLWFPTMKGVVSFHPQRLRRNAAKPTALIEEIWANERRLPLDAAGAEKQNSPLQIAAGAERIAIRYTALSLLFPDKVRFRYMLEGFDENWIDAGARREAYFTNLPPRSYVFRLQACNNDGVWSDVEASLEFEVLPRFYQTWQFVALCVLLALALLGEFIRWRLRAAKERERELAKLVDERTAEIQRQVRILDEQAREIKMNNEQLQEKNFQIQEEREKSDRLLLNILPPKIAQRLKAGEKIIADKFDSVTVMFADIVGFTDMSARIPPEHLVENLSMVFTLFDQLAERYGLEKIKTIGDAYMLVGGLPEPSDDHARLVAAMALEATRRIGELTKDTEEKISVRIGIHTGAVVAGVIGMRKFAYDLWGDTVNTASRMESTGEAGRVHCSEEVYQILRDDFEFEKREAIAIKGKGLMNTYFLLRAKS